MKAIRMVLLSALLTTTAATRAAECIGVTMPDQFVLDDKTLVLNGLGARLATMLKVKVYVAGLYLEQHSTDAAAIIATDQPRHLALHFVRNVDRKEITDAWTEGFKKNGADMKALAARIDTLNEAMTDLPTGSELVFSYEPSKGTAVSIDNNRKAEIAGADFASGLMAIWLGKPPNSEVKTGLLGGDCD